ncbi:hypothetical protein [Erwinia sorbitola]|uniref:Uncharacterized protein n=1 Tax=Erwinia sorbitola TaxID=2681984 RepID=A0A6I6EIV1_9GAMM|nr:hypothetical protein [Erwinia sorbitola]MTD26924.1 hypothetical protein [Erwinia sorbitola]QGU88488.1 hypothetical protein GN242_15245 [Erwinia sorbitola]
MASVNFFNASSVKLMFSINNGTYIPIASTSDTFDWVPLPPGINPTFINQSTPPQGVLGLGCNQLTLYPASSGAAASATLAVIIPEATSVSSVQIYLYWKDAKNLGAVVCNGGQFIQAISLP